MIENLQESTVKLLTQLIQIQSFSKEEDETAKLLFEFLEEQKVEVYRDLNNVYAYNKFFDENKPTILLNSHHDTVKPNPGYTRDPFHAEVIDGKLYGLGSNDAGGCLISLIHTFLYFYEKEDLKYNFCIAATAEEEISGKNGLEYLYPKLHPIDFAIVGEPTLFNAAIAEKGLLVVDVKVKGKAGHAAREEGDNAIYKAIDDIAWIKNKTWEKVSPYLGPVKSTVTIVNAGSQHNVVPEICEYTIDIRLTEEYSHEEMLSILKENLNGEVQPRSVRLRPSSIPAGHPVVQAAVKHGANTYGSPTTSDQALIPVPSLKYGPGDSARSHSANEFIYIDEVKNGVKKYIEILEEIV